MDARLDEVVLHALAKEPERRYQQAGEVKTGGRNDRFDSWPCVGSGCHSKCRGRSGRAPAESLLAVSGGGGAAVAGNPDCCRADQDAGRFGDSGPRWSPRNRRSAHRPSRPLKPILFQSWRLDRVLERTIHLASTGTNFLIRFETGELGTPPSESAGSSVGLHRWARQHGMDAGRRRSWSHQQRGVRVRHGRAGCAGGMLGGGHAHRNCGAARGGAASSWVILFHANRLPPETCAFRTRDGRIGIVQLAGLQSEPPGVGIRYKITDPVPAVSRAQADGVTTNTWAPILLPGEKPDLARILEDAKKLTASAHFQEALQRYQWHFDHARNSEIHIRIWSDSGQRFRIGRNWAGAIPKPNRRCLTSETMGRARLHRAVAMPTCSVRCGQSMKRCKTKKRRMRCFRAFVSTTPGWRNAAGSGCRICWQLMAIIIICSSTWAIRRSGFDGIRQDFERDRARYAGTDATANNGAQPAVQRVPPAPGFSPDVVRIIRQSAEKRFVSQTCQLIEILFGAGHKAEATGIRDQAVAVLDNERLKSAVIDAQKRVQQRSLRTGSL